MLDITPGVGTETATLGWLVEALAHARVNEQTKVVDYLEAVLDDAVFAIESAARHS